jgi:glycosyltransferase involved in cell wall biosynthesis
MGEIVEEGESGFLVAPGDAATLADRLVQLLADPSLARQMGGRGQARVSNQFLWRQVVDRVEAALLRLPLSLLLLDLLASSMDPLVAFTHA